MAEAKSPMGTNADKDNYGENNLWGEYEQNEYELEWNGRIKSFNDWQF